MEPYCLGFKAQLNDIHAFLESERSRKVIAIAEVRTMISTMLTRAESGSRSKSSAILSSPDISIVPKLIVRKIQMVNRI